MPPRPKLSSLLPAILWAAFVAAVLLAPGGLTPSDLGWADWLAQHGGDKLVHLVLFFGQAFWLSRVFERGSEGTRWNSAVLAAVYGGVLECAQLAVPGRGFEVADLAANTLGAFLWPLLGLLLVRR